jgi:hypothetical protein
MIISHVTEHAKYEPIPTILKRVLNRNGSTPRKPEGSESAAPAAPAPAAPAPAAPAPAAPAPAAPAPAAPAPAAPAPAAPKGSSAIADEIVQTKKKLQREINNIDIKTNNLTDNGLFDKKQNKATPAELDVAFNEIQGHLYSARKYLSAGDLEASDYYASLALRSYDKALYLSSWWWRFLNVYAGAIWIYLVGFLVAVLAFYSYQLDANFLNLHVRIQEAALHATTWGTIGAILRGLWFLKDKVSDRKYKTSYTIYFLSVPFLGALFGAILYLILVAGFFILAPTQAPDILNQTATSAPNATQTGSMNQTDTPTDSGGAVSTLAIIPLATLAGFNWEWAIMIFKRIGDTFKEEPEPDHHQKVEK